MTMIDLNNAEEIEADFDAVRSVFRRVSSFEIPGDDHLDRIGFRLRSIQHEAVEAKYEAGLVKLRGAKAERLLRDVLESHDLGHSPCTCETIRAFFTKREPSWEEQERQVLRMTGYGKLTPEEREALGIEENPGPP